MDLLQKTVLLFAALLTLAAGSFPPGTVICQAVDGELIIESSCDCESERPPCCEEDDCHESPEVAENHHSIGTADKCIDTLISVENYTEQDAVILSKQFDQKQTFSDFISLIAGRDFPLDVGDKFCPDPPFPQSSLQIIRTTVLII